jgi:hypothetical protein
MINHIDLSFDADENLIAAAFACSRNMVLRIDVVGTEGYQMYTRLLSSDYFVSVEEAVRTERH